MDDDAFVYYTPLPKGIKEMVVPCDGGYTIYIDRNLTTEQMMRAYRHALRHINNNDFASSDVQKIERRAHE